jgi:PHD/YefM family antitoxin component YafN of YafNO toxin-antitoxin module
LTALRNPIIILKNNAPKAVLMSIDAEDDLNSVGQAGARRIMRVIDTKLTGAIPVVIL